MLALGLAFALALTGSPTTPPPSANKGAKIALGGAVAFGAGAGMQWLGVGLNDDPGASGRVGLTTLGGMAMVGATALAASAGKKLGEGQERDARRGRTFKHVGIAAMTTGGLAMAGTLIAIPVTQRRCGDFKCSLAALQLSAAVVAPGLGMWAYGREITPWNERRRIDKKAVPFIASGAAVFAASYIISATIGVSIAESRDDRLGRSIRNKMLVPVVGPAWYAAGPDADLGMAIVASGLSLGQLVGLATTVTGVAVHASRRGSRAKRQVSVTPAANGIAVSGRF